MPVKTYVLLETMDSTAPIFQQVAGGQRVRLTKIPFHRPPLRITFQDENGVSKTIRYKSGASDEDGNSVIDQRVQIDKLKLDANEPFTTQERKDCMFRNGILVTNKLITQAFLDAHPENITFKGFCDDVKSPKYKLLDKAVESQVKNSDTKLRIKAANKVSELELPELQAMLIRLNGSFFETPNPSSYEGTKEQKVQAATEECQNMLWDFIDDAEEAGLKAVLAKEDEINIDVKTSVLIGKLINNDMLSFDAVEGKISKKDRDGKWITIRDMSSEYALEERERLFSDFLNTEDGKTLKNDLEKDLSLLSENEQSDVNIKIDRRRKENKVVMS